MAKGVGQGKGGGRPPKLTAKVQADICFALEAGNFIDPAAAFAGVSKRAVCNWLRKGRNSKGGPCKRFVEACEAAMHKAEMREVGNLRTLMAGDPGEPGVKADPKRGIEGTPPRAPRPPDRQAITWWLSRRFPDRWGQAPVGVRVDASAAGGEEGEASVKVGLYVYLPEEDGGGT